MTRLNNFFLLLYFINCKQLYHKFTLKQWKAELLIQMNKWLYKRIHISLYISIYDFQNLSKLFSFVSMVSHYFLCQKITQLNILVNIMSPWSYDMDCNARFLAFQKSNTLW
jgi:hypothetical protein